MPRDNSLGRTMKWEKQDPAGEDGSCWQLELTANWQGRLPPPLHVHLGRGKSVQDRFCFWWTQGQTVAGDPLRQLRSATKLGWKLREGRKRLHQRLQWRVWRDPEADELEEGERGVGG